MLRSCTITRLVISETLLDFRDALTVGITRLYRHRGWRHFAHVNPGWDRADTIRHNAIKALIAVSCCAREYVFRPLDVELREARRVEALKGEFGPGGESGPVDLILDGLGVRVQYPKPPKTHRVMHSQYQCVVLFFLSSSKIVFFDGINLKMTW